MCLCVAVSVPCILHAQIRITEIMYDLAEGADGGREWIEIENIGTESIDLTDWRFFENSVNHGITETGDVFVPPGARAIIADNPAKFRNDWPAFDGLLFDSAFSFSNTGETLIMRCCGKDLADIDTLSYSSDMGANGDGLSLHRGASLTAALPSPGSAEMTQPAPKPQAIIEPAPAKAIASEPKPEPKPIPKPEPKPQPKLEQMPLPVIEMPDEPEPAETNPMPVAQVRETAQTPQKQEELSESDVLEAEPVLAGSPPSQEEAQLPEASIPEANDTRMLAAAAASADGSTKGDEWFWWASALMLAIIGAGAVRYVTNMTRKEWEIEEIE